MNIQDIPVEKVPAWSTGDPEIDLLFTSDGGLVPSLILVSGEPGSGKSSLVRQLADKLQKTGAMAVVFSNEENMYNLKEAAQRMKLNFMVEEASSISGIIAKCNELRKANPGKRFFVMIDSLQSFSSGSSKKQMEDMELLYVWRKDATIFLVSQVGKKGVSLGVNGISHKVDSHLHLKQDKLKRSPTYGEFIVEMQKNRVGPANVQKLYTIGELGFKLSPPNPLKAKLAAINAALGGTDKAVRKVNQGIRIAKFFGKFF